MAIGATLFALFGLLAVGLPMVVALLATAFISLVLLGGWQMTIPQVVISQMGTFTVASFPLFILAGGLMNAGGVSGRLFSFAGSLVGFLKGGLAQVDVLLSLLFGGMIGSSMADIAGTGSLTIPAMKKHGYRAADAAAVTASSSAIGALIPPSSPMILYSALSGTSLGALFIAGIIPGLILGVALMTIVFVLARRYDWPRHGDFHFTEIVRTGRHAVLAFGMPLIMIGGLTFGVFTPTESGAFGAVYAAGLSYFVYRSVGPADLYKVVVNAVRLTGELTVILGLAAVLSWCLASAGIPAMLRAVVDTLVVADSNVLRLVVIMVVAILVGTVLDPLSPILVPVVLPLLIAYQIDLIHFGVLMVMFGAIGQITPPLGIALIVSGKIADVPQARVWWANMPFLLVTMAVTLLLIAVPELSTWLPKFLMGR